MLTVTAAVPLLLVKLWTVFPRLFQTVPRESVRRLALHGLERGSVLVLVAAAIFMPATGRSNAAQWYPWSFSFRSSHYSVAWIAVGALVVPRLRAGRHRCSRLDGKDAYAQSTAAVTLQTCTARAGAHHRRQR